MTRQVIAPRWTREDEEFPVHRSGGTSASGWEARPAWSGGHLVQRMQGPNRPRRRRLRIGILGPILTCVDGREVTLSQTKLRMLLASLAIRANKVASNDMLIEDLWGDDPPATALRALRVYVSQLRKFLSAHEVDPDCCRLVTQRPGYRLIVADEVLDRHHFDSYCQQARAAAAEGQLRRAHRLYRQALSLCRGSSLADVRVGSSLENAARWLDEARLGVLMRSIDIELRLGLHLEVVSELAELAAEHPLNEGLHARLMIALYGCGRANDALAVYRSLREVMIDDLGTEPGPDIQRIHQAILTRDHAVLR